MLNKTVWLLWLQGWDDVPWLIKQVAESWEINNPDWNIKYVTLSNLHKYVCDIDYIYDKTKEIEPQAKSDIIRLSLLRNHGGVWADATMLCMQPLSSWAEEVTKPAGVWMYHGTCGNPASWFILAEKDSLIMNQWKSACDEYWQSRNKADSYFWLDGLFKKLFDSDIEFKNLWNLVPYLYCNAEGQAHSMAGRNFDLMVGTNQQLQKIFQEEPPYALKFWLRVWQDKFPDINSTECKNSNGYFAIQMSERKFIFRHKMTSKSHYMKLFFGIERFIGKMAYVSKGGVKNLLKSFK